MQDLSPRDLKSIRTELDEGENAKFTNEQIEARYQYQHANKDAKGNSTAVADVVAVLRDSAARQASSDERRAARAARRGGLRASEPAEEEA